MSFYFVKNIFAGHKTSRLMNFLFQHWRKMLFYLLFMVLHEKSAVILIFVPLYEMFYYLWLLLRYFVLVFSKHSDIFENGFLLFNLFELIKFVNLFPSTKLWHFQSLLLQIIFCTNLILFSGTLMTRILDLVILFHRSLRHCSFSSKPFILSVAQTK